MAPAEEASRRPGAPAPFFFINNVEMMMQMRKCANAQMFFTAATSEHFPFSGHCEL